MRSTSVESEYPTLSSLVGTQFTLYYRDSGAILGASQIYETLLRTGKTKKTCTACNRHLNAQEMVVFENYVSTFDLPPMKPDIDNYSFCSAPRANETDISREA